MAFEGHLFTEQELNAVMQQTNVEYVLAYTVPLAGCPYPTNYQALEYTHSNIHLWLGGDMKVIFHIKTYLFVLFSPQQHQQTIQFSFYITVLSILFGNCGDNFVSHAG
jgi:hypothetical protein